MTWVALLVELLTKGWPVTAVVLTILLRKPIEDLFGRIIKAEVAGLKVDLQAAQKAADEKPLPSKAPPFELPPGPAHRLGEADFGYEPPLEPGRLEKRAPPVPGARGPSAASAAAPALSGGASGVSGPPLPAGEQPPVSSDPWRRCGNIYWLGNNITFAGLAILNGDLDAGRKELNNAIHHAKQLPIDVAFVEALRELEGQNLSDPSAQKFVIERLVLIGSRIGRFIAHQQRDFPERDITLR